MRKTTLVSILFSLLFGQLVQAADSSDLNFIATDAIKKAGFPLSNAVEADGWVFLSGALGTIPGKGLVEGGIEPETRQTMENIQSLLKEQGMGMDRIVKCTGRYG